MILEFDNCRLSNEQVLGEVDGGFEVMNTWLYALVLRLPPCQSAEQGDAMNMH